MMDTRQAAPSREQIRDLLRTNGLRSTGPRVAVLDFLQSTHVPLSHAEIADALAAEGFDRATIYRNLIDLSDAQLIVRADRGDHVWRFELRRETPQHAELHPHFLCNDCGTVSCVADVTMPNPQSLSVGQISEVLIKGRCSDCII